MKKLLKKLAPLSLLVLMVACADPYKDGMTTGQTEGYQEGYDKGYDEGKVKGDEAGYARAKTYFESAGYNEGFSDGKKVGLSSGYADGYAVGKKETYQPAYDSGYIVGKVDGKKEGYDLGYDDGYDDGFDDGHDERYKPLYDAGFKSGYNNGYKDGNVVAYDDGYDDGEADGYDLGYDDGMDDGYDVGYDDGFYDGGLSVGKTKQLKGFANLISLAHNDLIDYTKIKAPKETKRGLVANGQLLFSETSLTNKDTLKRAAVTEQYLVVEMAKQVKGKFGLSADRSLKVAKAANHFRKQASSRALTAEDTNAYASEIIGSDFRSISKAYEKTLQGDLTAFDSVLDRAAEKNGTSPENIAIMLTQYFM
jgi:flagellar biosynthesis/type III secretory pathway protein FliH